MNKTLATADLHKPTTTLVQPLMGSLGDQLFQIAFASLLARASRCKLVFDTSSFNTHHHLGKSILPGIFPDAEVIDPDASIPVKTSCVLSEAVLVELLAGNPLPQPYALPTGFTHILLDGHWQDHHFVDPIELSSVQNRLKNRAKVLAEPWIKRITSCAQPLAIHLRRHDYKHHGLCSEAYYIEAIRWLQARHGALDLFVFTDEPNYTSHFLNEAGIKPVLVSSGDEATDLYLMSLCPYQVISNSSHAWWGARLASAKCVIYPDPWSLLRKPSSQLCPPHWLCVTGSVEKNIPKPDFFRTLNLEKLRINSTSKKIGLLVIATGKYDVFIQPLFESMKKYFLNNHDVTMFVFTDRDIPEVHGLVRIQQEHLGWPRATLDRYSVFLKNRALLESQDYLFYCDADMVFVDTVGDEVLGDLVATLHPGFYRGIRGTYETRRESTAYVGSNEGKHYYAGGFNGGEARFFLNMAEKIEANIARDDSNNIIAIWHDESHFNRYLIDNEPTIKLSPSYCYPESWNLPLPKKLLALDKNHAQMRS